MEEVDLVNYSDVQKDSGKKRLFLWIGLAVVTVLMIVIGFRFSIDEKVSGVVELDENGELVLVTESGERYVISGDAGLSPGDEVSGEVNDDGEVVVVEEGPSVLSSSELEDIAAVRREMAEGDLSHIDYRPVYGYLDGKKGNTEVIGAICDEFDSIFCLKYASSVNENIRSEICDELERRLREDYSKRVPADKLKGFVQGHLKDCGFGYIQMMY